MKKRNFTEKFDLRLSSRQLQTLREEGERKKKGMSQILRDYIDWLSSEKKLLRKDRKG